MLTEDVFWAIFLRVCFKMGRAGHNVCIFMMSAQYCIGVSFLPRWILALVQTLTHFRTYPVSFHGLLSFIVFKGDLGRCCGWGKIAVRFTPSCGPPFRHFLISLKASDTIDDTSRFLRESPFRWTWIRTRLPSIRLRFAESVRKCR